MSQLNGNSSKNGRLSEVFHKKVKDIQLKHELKQKHGERLSTEVVTLLIAKHKDFNNISEDIINLNMEEIKKIKLKHE